MFLYLCVCLREKKVDKIYNFKMLCFNSDRTYSPISPLKKPSVGRRSFLRQIIQASILSGLIIILFMFGRDLLWSSSTNSYTIDPRDMDIVQSLCNTSMTNNQGEELQQQEVPSYLTEPTIHFRPDTVIPSYTWETLPSKSVLYMVVRNEDIQEARSAMRSVEDRFNHHFKYPWVLLNDQDFTPTFQKYILKVTDAPIYFGKIDSKAWNYPKWIDIRSAEDHMDIMYALNVYRGGSLSFRQLLRYKFNSFYFTFFGMLFLYVKGFTKFILFFSEGIILVYLYIIHYFVMLNIYGELNLDQKLLVK